MCARCATSNIIALLMTALGSNVIKERQRENKKLCIVLAELSRTRTALAVLWTVPLPLRASSWCLAPAWPLAACLSAAESCSHSFRAHQFKMDPRTHAHMDLFKQALSSHLCLYFEFYLSLSSFYFPCKKEAHTHRHTLISYYFGQPEPKLLPYFNQTEPINYGVCGNVIIK